MCRDVLILEHSTQTLILRLIESSHIIFFEVFFWEHNDPSKNANLEEGDKGQVFRIRQKYLTFLLYHRTALCSTAHFTQPGENILILFPTRMDPEVAGSQRLQQTVSQSVGRIILD